MKILFTYFLWVSTNLCFAQTKADDFQLFLNGQNQKIYSIEEMKQMKSTQVEFYDHVTRKTDFYKGVPFLSLINLIEANQVKKIVEVELTSVNGYKAYFPIESFYKVDAILTYQAVGESKFERFSQKEKKMVNLGPYYLVWDFKTIGKFDKNQFNSVYQITKINLISNMLDFGVRDSKVDQNIILGYRTYKKYCLSCHAIGNWGGEVGADLIKKKTIESHGADFLVKYALDPKSINPQTKMLPLPKYKNSESMAQGIADFLTFAKNPEEYIQSKKIEADKPRYQALKNILNDVRGKTN